MKKKHRRVNKTGGENHEYDFGHVELAMPGGHTGDYFQYSVGAMGIDLQGKVGAGWTDLITIFSETKPGNHSLQ